MIDDLNILEGTAQRLEGLRSSNDVRRMIKGYPTDSPCTIENERSRLKGTRKQRRRS